LSYLYIFIKNADLKLFLSETNYMHLLSIGVHVYNYVNLCRVGLYQEIKASIWLENWGWRGCWLENWGGRRSWFENWGVVSPKNSTDGNRAQV